MRSIRVRYVMIRDLTSTIEVETEVLLEDDDRASEAGKEAAEILHRVAQGLDEWGEQVE